MLQGPLGPIYGNQGVSALGQGGQAPGPHIAEGVEHPRALRQSREPRPVLPVIIEPLAFGLILTNYQSFGFINNFILAKHEIKPLTKTELDFYRELVFLLKIFFFIFLGIQFEIKEYSLLAFAIALVFFIFIFRIPIIDIISVHGY